MTGDFAYDLKSFSTVAFPLKEASLAIVTRFTLIYKRRLRSLENTSAISTITVRILVYIHSESSVISIYIPSQVDTEIEIMRINGNEFNSRGRLQRMRSSRSVVFNRFVSQTRRCNFSSCLYAKTC
jgi:hypothetical protein